jgi:hypothetical protein
MMDSRSMAEWFPGSARVSRVGFGVSPKRSFLTMGASGYHAATEVRDGAEAVAHTRDACAPQISRPGAIWNR